MDAVAGNDDIAHGVRQASAVRARKMHGHRATVLAATLIDTGAAVPGEEVLRADPRAHRAEQNPLQIGARQGDVRPLMAGGLAERLAVDQLPMAGEEGVVFRLA
jgi:hypothetical protein